MNFLVSYAFLKTKPDFMALVEALSPSATFLIDCGAFSNWGSRLKRAIGLKGQAEITLSDYITACKTHFHGKVWQYISLDVVRDPTQTDLNLQMMLDAGLLPMPVVPEGCPPEKVASLVAINPRLCVAGGAFSSDGVVNTRYREIYEASSGQALIHGLGYNRFPDLFYVPISTCDSSSYSKGAQFGQVSRYSREKGFSTISYGELQAEDHRLSPKKRLAWITYLHDTCSIPYPILENEVYYHRWDAIPNLVSIYAYLQFMAHAHTRDREVFLAPLATGLLFAPLAVLSALKAPAPDMGFNYLEARETYRILVDQAKSAPTRCVQSCQDILTHAVSSKEPLHD